MQHSRNNKTMALMIDQLHSHQLSSNNDQKAGQS
jgi:hypothetical protein